MTREEQIKNYAINNCIQDDIDDTSYEIIVETAKWADETMLDKARKWFEKTLYIHTEINEDNFWGERKPIDWVTSDHDSVEELVNDFCKAMEE